MIPRDKSAAAGILLLVALLTACAPPADPPASPGPRAVEPSPVASPAPVASTAPETPGELTCESMISAGTVNALTDIGWTAEAKEFVVGGVELEDGLLCFWADYSVASDHGQLYGWSALTGDDAARAQAGLLAEGWKREDGTDGIYFTEDPQYSMGLDDDGYGMTYLFGDGWVKFADTRQGLILVEWTG